MSAVRSTWASDLKNAAQALAILAALYLAYKLYKQFTGGNDSPDEYQLENRWQDNVRLPDGTIMNVMRGMLDSHNVFPHMAVLYKLTSANNAERAPAGTRYTFSDGGTAIQNATGPVTWVE